jgi:selenocysteine-specific elongation factor
MAPNRRRGTASTLPTASDAAAAAVRMVEEAGPSGMAAATLAARVTVPLPALLAALQGRDDVVSFGGGSGSLVAAAALRALGASVEERLREFHGARRLEAGMPREELRRRVFSRAPDGVFEAVLDALAGEGRVRVSADTVALAAHSVRLTPDETRVREALLAAAAAAGLAGVDLAHLPPGLAADGRLVEKMARTLVAEGAVRRVGDMVVESGRLDDLLAEVRRRWAAGSRLDVAAFKDMTGLSRKYVIPLLEYLDRERVTRRTGPDRYVIG